MLPLKQAAFTLLLALGLGSSAAQAERPSPGSEFPTPLHVPSIICGECHEDIYRQWQASMHARSAPGQDPVFSAVYEELVGAHNKEGLTLNGDYPACLQCHAPNAAKDQKTDISQLNYAEGVNCVVCHVLADYKGMEQVDGKAHYGLNAYNYSDTHLQGPSGRYLSPKQDAQHTFPINPNQVMLRTSQVCLGCHGSYHNANGVPIYQTGEEYASNEGENATCQSCHMPKLDGVASHAILSAHSDSQLARPVVITLQSNKKGETIQLKVKLKNTLPHGFPTGNPFRNAQLKVTAYDKKDNLLWSNYQGYPPDFSQDPQALLEYRVTDKDGQPVSAYIAEKAHSDTRLKPFEARELSYAIPAQNVYLLRAELLYNILTPELIAQHGERFEGNLTNPAVAAIAELKLK